MSDAVVGFFGIRVADAVFLFKNPAHFLRSAQLIIEQTEKTCHNKRTDALSVGGLIP